MAKKKKKGGRASSSVAAVGGSRSKQRMSTISARKARKTAVSLGR